MSWNPDVAYVATVVKHAEHNQSTHGSWAHGRVRKVVEESLRRASIGESLDADAMGLFLPPGHRDASTPEEDLAKVVKAQGWDQPAPLLSDDEFKSAYDTGKFTLVYRVGPIGLEQGILKGTPYIGTGYHGPGTYVTDNYLGVLPYVSIDKSRSVVPMLVPTEMIVDVWGRPVSNHYQQAATEAQGAVRTTRKSLGDGTYYSEYLVFNTSALLVGRPSEFPEPGSINFYIEDLPRGETADWARFEKADEWEHGPYYMLVDGKAVLIEFDDDEVVKHGEHDQSTHGSWAHGRGVLVYPETDWQSRETKEERQRALEEQQRLHGEFIDAVFSEDPMGSDDDKWDGWWTARNMYVAEQSRNEDIAVIVNRGLRSGRLDGTDRRVRMFDSMVKASTVKRDFQVWRSAVLTSEQVESLRQGAEFVDLGFQSSDVSRGSAEFYGFARWAHGGRDRRGQRDGVPVLFRMTVKAGTNATNVGAGEVVIQRDARVRVTSDAQNVGPFMYEGRQVREFDVYGDPESGYVYSPDVMLVDVEVSG